MCVIWQGFFASGRALKAAGGGLGWQVLRRRMPWVWKCVFLRHVYIKMMNLPRQARDKDGTNFKKDAFLQVLESEKLVEEWVNVVRKTPPVVCAI